MNSENEDSHRRSLKLLYLKYKTTDSNTKAKPEADTEEETNESKNASTPQAKEIKLDLLNHYSRNAFSSTNSNQEGTSEAVVLRRNQQKEDVQLELENIKAKLAEYKETIENQQRESEHLKSALSQKAKEQEATSRELNLAKEVIAKKEMELNQVKEEIGKEDLEIRNDLRKEKEKNTEILDLLTKEREQNCAIKQELSALKETLVSSVNVEKQLENFIVQESAKTKKLEKQLTYLLNRYNNEREHVYNHIQEIFVHSEDFLKYCEDHSKTLSETVSKINA
ncbi:hypothetical protein ILUMI_08086 [Ignelater luminosus]|uniref:Uncharacterized protein n=1 Tax=Ignelater luminosus TaxID=2038154 RepID=A0A8K0D6Z4_IGNLU|nr:hypothetical protein ILUMI_08086 [Ignelater luminosus]